MDEESTPPSVPQPGSVRLLGKVASPEGDEATSEEFTFWVADDVLVEKTQIVYAQSTYDDRLTTFHAVVDEVYRRSHRRTILEEADRFGSDPNARVSLDSQGVTYAKAKILRAEPPVLSPPREESFVWLSGPREARLAYGVEQMGQSLAIGLLENGGSANAGPAYIDLDYLLGANGAHLNVNGVAGAATKSSFLMSVLFQLLEQSRAYARENPSAQDTLRVVPIVLNVKGYDLMWLDYLNTRYRPERDAAVWRELGASSPSAFADARFLAPEQRRAGVAVPIGRPAERYSWSLGDVIELGLFPYLFGDEDREDENFLGILMDIEATITNEEFVGNESRRSLRRDVAANFQELLEWIAGQIALPDGNRLVRNHAPGTWRKFYRRLRRVVQEGDGVLSRFGNEGRPLRVTAAQTTAPIVVDISSVRDQAIQRFIVAAIFSQVMIARTGTNAVPNLAYVLVIDELNRWAPKGASDPITRLIEKVVAEMRSQGIVLFGAQQQASQVSPRVIENSSIRALGRTGSLELSQPLWGFLSAAAKRRAQNLQADEKLVCQVNLREPMQVRVPFPYWAMRRAEADLAADAGDFDRREEFER